MLAADSPAERQHALALVKAEDRHPRIAPERSGQERQQGALARADRTKYQAAPEVQHMQVTAKGSAPRGDGVKEGRGSRRIIWTRRFILPCPSGTHRQQVRQVHRVE